MSSDRLSRRDFLKYAGIALGGTVLVASGLSFLEDPQPVISLREYSFGGNKMEKRILVTYASRTGSTAGVAEAVGKTLAAGGAQVDVLPMSRVTDLAPYRAVVAGSAIQGGQWLPEAMQFVQGHRADLARVPFAAFLVCMTLAMKKGDYRQHVATWLDPVRGLVKPVSQGLFAGVLDIAKIPSFGDRLKFRISAATGIWSEGDHRDWNAIQAWSESLRPLLLH